MSVEADVGKVLLAAQAELSRVRSVLDSYVLQQPQGAAASAAMGTEGGSPVRPSSAGAPTGSSSSSGAHAAAAPTAEVYESLKAALAKAESSLRVKAEAVMRQAEERSLNALAMATVPGTGTTLPAVPGALSAGLGGAVSPSAPSAPSPTGRRRGAGAAGPAATGPHNHPYRSYHDKLRDSQSADYLARPEHPFGRAFVLDRYQMSPTPGGDQKDARHGGSTWLATASMSPTQLAAAALAHAPTAASGGDGALFAAAALTAQSGGFGTTLSGVGTLLGGHANAANANAAAAALITSPSRAPTVRTTPGRVAGRPIERYGRSKDPSARVRGRTAAAAPSLVPRAVRANPRAYPTLTPADADQGVLSLLQRGRIPAFMDVGPALTSEPAPLRPVAATFHHYHAQFEGRGRTHNTTQPYGAAVAGGFNLAAVKIDLHSTLDGATASGPLNAYDDADLPAPLQPAPGYAHTHPAQPHASAAPLQDDEDEKGFGEERARAALRTTQMSFGATALSAVPAPPREEQKPPRTGEQELEFEAQQAAAARARGYHELLDAHSLHHFMIRHGKVVEHTPEFVSYRRTYAHVWGQVQHVVRQLEDLLTRYGVRLAIILGQRVVEVAADELPHTGGGGAPLPVDTLLSCIQDVDGLHELLKIPGRRYKGPLAQARVAAATKIQATVRMWVKRRHFRRHKVQNYSAARVQDVWRRHAARVHTRAAIAATWARSLEHWRTHIQTPFRARWATHWVHKSRVAVHVPSLSVRGHQRASLHNFAVRQNAQLARLCDAADPLVDVVYVAPFELHDDVQSYYLKLLEVGGVANAAQRIKILAPENFARFPEHFSLAKLALYSPKLLKRIRSFVGGRPAYLVPHSCGLEDLKLAVALDLPLYGAEPDVSAIFGSKSGGRRIFQLADASIAPGAHDIVDDDDLYANLSRLVVEHLDVARWLFKIDNEFGGRGLAYFDTAHIKPVLDIVRADKQHAGERWALPDIIGAAVERVAVALRKAVPQRTVLAAPALYTTPAAAAAAVAGMPATERGGGGGARTAWSMFASALYRVGGVIEASAPHVLCSPSANVLIEPDGTVSVTSAHDQIFTTPFQYGGAVFPSAAPGGLVHGAAKAIGQACAKEGVLGHLGVDFVLWYDTQAQQHRLWAVDLNLHYTTTQASFALFHFLMKGRYELAPVDGRIRYVLPPSTSADSAGGADEKRPASSASVASLAASTSSLGSGAVSVGGGAGGAADERSYATVNYLYHPNLATVQFGSFFNLCRLKGVSFDLRARKGTAFMMADSLASGTIGVLCVQRQPLPALRSLCSALDFLTQHISALRAGASGGGGGAAGVVGVSGGGAAGAGSAPGTIAAHVHVYADQSNLKDAAIVCRALLKARDDQANAALSATATASAAGLGLGLTGIVPAGAGAGAGASPSASDKLRARTLSGAKARRSTKLNAKPTPTAAATDPLSGTLTVVSALASPGGGGGGGGGNGAAAALAGTGAQTHAS